MPTTGVQTANGPQRYTPEDKRRRLYDLTTEELIALIDAGVITANEIREIFDLPPDRSGSILKKSQ